MEHELFTDLSSDNYIFLEVTTDNISFFVKGEAILELTHNGDIYVKGKLIENDKQVVDALRVFLKAVST